MNRRDFLISAGILISGDSLMRAAAGPEGTTVAPRNRTERIKKVTNIEGCIAFWDFVKRERNGSHRFIAHIPAGEKNNYPLDASNYIKDYWNKGRSANYADFPLLGRGPFGQAIRIRDEKDDTFRPFFIVPRSRLHDSPLDIKGAGRSLTVVAWAIRESGNHALAGIWHEGIADKEAQGIKLGQRQYGLFAGLQYEGSALGHISENGAGSFGNKYALHKAYSSDISPTVPAESPSNMLDSSWQCFAMTFDNRRHEITGWLNGNSGDRWLESPNSALDFSSVYKAWQRGQLNSRASKPSLSDRDTSIGQFYNPPEDHPISIEVLSEDADRRLELQEFRYTRVRVTLQKDADGRFRETSRDLNSLRLNPWWYPYDYIYSPLDERTGGPFSIGRVIHSSHSVGFTGWIGGVAVFDRALSAEELTMLSALRHG